MDFYKIYPYLQHNHIHSGKSNCGMFFSHQIICKKNI